MEYETAGDPISGLKWTRKTTEKIADELATLGIVIGKNTVGNLLKTMGYSLRLNHKKIANGGKKISLKDRKKRDNQFQYIAELRKNYAKKGFPIISVDGKKKEIIGNFKNQGRAWGKHPDNVNDHDFPSYSTGKGIPYSIYDTVANRGSVFVGTTSDTPSFAVDSIEQWWKKEGSKRYNGKNKLYILADSGGSNSARSRVWKYKIQNILCDRYGLTVKVSHYPPGASKWNPADHRLHSEISKNWAGKPLLTYETMLKYIRTTTTKTGLKVNACLVRKNYKKGIKVSKAQFETLSIKFHDELTAWNYTLKPR